MNTNTRKPANHRERAARRWQWRRLRSGVAAVAALVLGGLVLGPVPAASAGTLNLVVTPIDTADSSVITDISDGTHSNRITYQVQFSCQATSCNDAQVQFSPSQADPYGLLPAGRYLLSYESWVAPVSGGTISGTNDTGMTVGLGNLAAGQSGTFSLTYQIMSDTSRTVPYGSFYPDGFQIQMGATISSSNSASFSTNASPVTWGVDMPPASSPGALITTATSSKPDSNVTYSLAMGPGNMTTSGFYLTGDASRQAIGNYTLVYHLPPEADYVSADLGGVYDPVGHTVTWEAGTLADPVYAARGGWGLNQTSGYNGGGAGLDNPPGSVLGDDDYAYFYFRQVVLNFPGENFPAADENGCNFSANVTSTIDLTVGYLDSARTVRTTTASRTAQIACWDPFVGVDVQKYVENYSGIVGSTYMVNRPAPGEPPLTSAYWYVQIGNRGNVPAVAVIDEPNLSQPDLQVYQIWPYGTSATIEWTRSDGVTGTSTLAHNQAVTAPAGTWFTSARATTAPIAPGRIQPTDTTQTTVYIDYRFRVTDTAPLGETRTNTANVSVSYPGITGPIDDTTGTEVTLPLERTATRTMQFTQRSPIITAAFPSAPVVNGPSLTPGTEVTYTATGGTDQIWPGTTIVPQYVYVAPIGWNVVPGSATVPGAPAGTTYSYGTAVVGGVSRAIAVATWPSAITPITTGPETWPQLTVRATPTASAPTGVNAATALVWAGDASGTLSDSIGASQLFITADNQFRARPATAVDTGDADGDANTTEEFAQATSAPLTVAGSSGLQVIKELCLPDDTQPDGCLWTADASSPHFVAVTADDITYRITITNGGGSTLTNVVAYDVLPHVGDTSLTSDATPRGSEFDLTIQSVEDVSAGITMAYSPSTNPTRPEVYPGAPGAVDNWGATAAGMSAARITVGSLPAGQSRSVVIVAGVDGTGEVDQQACNSVAIDSSQTLPTEPTAVCVTLAEADLAIELTEFENLQAGRPTTLAYTVTNHGDSTEAPATVTIEVPDGVTVTNLTVTGWVCTVNGGGTAPVPGPVTLTCAPVDGGGQPRPLQEDAAELLALPIVVTDDSGELCTNAEVTGTLYDPELGNNSDNGCDEIAPPPAGLVIDKDDDQTSTQIGAEYDYTITITNTLLGEAVNDVVVTDTLPASLEFASATSGGVYDPVGHTVTWSLDALTPMEEVELQVTVRVLGGAISPVVNDATVSAPDPGFPDEVLEDSDSDSDVVLQLAVTKTSDAAESGVQPGDVVTYTVTVTGDDAGDYTDVTITDDLSDVLDEATFVAGSGSLSIDGGAAEDVDDPVGDLLTWTGTIPAGVDAVLTYQVTVGEPANGQLLNTVSTAPDPTDCDTGTGLDEDGLACAVLTTAFAPSVSKTVESLTQGDDGTWTIQYGIDVVNPAPTDTVYDLSDDLAFGLGITVTSATVTPPAGITPETWTGSGDITLAGALPGSTTHHYTVVVVADAGTVAGTAAAVCTPGAALGFANTATLTLGDGTELDTEACAEPAEPTVTKELDGAPVQGVDGRWTVTYLITVTNTAEQPTTGLAYHLEDALDFPAGLTVDELQVLPPAGVTANTGFTGGLTEIGGAAVPADQELVDGVARIPAATGGSAAVHEYRVQLVITAGAGSVDETLLTCGPTGAGYGNWVSLMTGTTELGQATACADIRLPELQFTKIAATPDGTRPGDRIVYTIIVTNVGDADFTAGDPAELVDDMSDVVDDGRYLGDAFAGDGTILSLPPTLTWTGPLPAGETVEIQYTVLLGEAGSGDGNIVNQVRLASLGTPGGAVPDCADTPADNDGEPACQVSLQLDTRSLAFTGAVLPLGVLLAAAGAAVLAGIFLTRRRRQQAG